MPSKHVDLVGESRTHGAAAFVQKYLFNQRLMLMASSWFMERALLLKVPSI
jgi:hypothetical protein